MVAFYCARHPIAKVENEASWHWHKGNKHTYTNTHGKKVTTKEGYKYLITFTYDRGRTLGGSRRGTLTLYNQNKVVEDPSTAFSGGGWFEDFGKASKGNYMMNLSIRSIMPKENPTSDYNQANPPPNMGMQKIENGTVIKYPDGSTHNVNSDYGNYRIRLQPTDGSRDRGLYLHGKKAFWTARTHGCVCEKDQTVLEYLWENKEITGKVPFAVQQKTVISNNEE